MSLNTYFVEDNATIRENLVSALEELADVVAVGYATGETDAIRWLSASEGWTLAIVDLFLQQGSGVGVLQATTGRKPHQKVIVLSNYATPEMRRRCMELGADAVFDKSSDIDALLLFCNACGRPH